MASKHDFTPTARKRVYDSLITILGAVVAVAAIWGIVVPEFLVEAVTALLPSLLGALGAFLARRNVDDGYVGEHRAEP